MFKFLKLIVGINYIKYFNYIYFSSYRDDMEFK